MSVLAGSPVTLSGRAADGSVSGTYTNPKTLQAFAFTVRATSATSAVATIRILTIVVQITLTGPSNATMTVLDAEEPENEPLGAVTGFGPRPTDYGSKFVVDILGNLFDTAIRTIPLELSCGQGFAPVEIATLLFPWQVVSKYDFDPTTRYADAQAATEAATCSIFPFAGASPTEPITPAAKPPSGSGLINLGNDDTMPTVLGFFPLDDVGAKEKSASQSAVPLAGINTAYGPCNSMCRGACGADCEPNNCKSATGLSKCETDTQGKNTCWKLVYTDYTCGTHPACKWHDDCYDMCNMEYGCGTWDANFCMHTMGHPGGITSCDQHVIDTYGASAGVDWARGYGEQNDTQIFRYQTAREYDDKQCPCVHECVPAGTLVSRGDGTVMPIESFQKGDALATIATSGTASAALVEKVLVHRDGPYSLDRLESADGAELLVTPNHPVWTVELGWVQASDLVVGAHVLELDPATGEPHPSVLVSIVRAASTTDVVYNLKTSRSSYVAAGILVHNKCLARGSLVDGPSGAVAVETLRPGDLVFGEVDGKRVATRVLRTYEKTTILGTLPGRRLAEHLVVTENHRVVTRDGDVEASRLPAASEEVSGVVYDLATESGNYWAEGVLLRGADSRE